MKFCVAALALSLATSTAAHLFGRPNTKQSETLLAHLPSGEEIDPEALYPAYNFTTPIDHFHNDTLYEPHVNGTFPMRYWFDAQYYKPGGPVIVLMAGETSGVGRLVFLQKGILHQMAKATGGVGVVLEHRYYGTSFPVDDLSTENLRFLTTDQALADTTYFAQNVQFEGLEDCDLTAPGTAWIAYGGSYAGAFAAFLRKLYPETWWGAISSSGVTVAQWNFWQYFEAARVYGPEECVVTTQKLVDAMDNILIDNPSYSQRLKEVFGLGVFDQDDDFVNYLGNTGIGGLQGLNWDPEVSSEEFNWYCGNLSSSSVEFPDTESSRSTVEELLRVGGYEDEVDNLSNRMLNWIGYNNATNLQTIGPLDESFIQQNTQHDTSYFQQNSIEDTWRAWPYQYCTQWGYIQSATGVPEGQLPMISKLITLEYQTNICRQAFGLTEPANTDAINKYGGFELFYDRLAHIGGVRDPWRWVTPLADSQPDRPNTVDQPFFNIENGVHHWDENGVFENETYPGFPPEAVVDSQTQIREFVQAWMDEWRASHYERAL